MKVLGYCICLFLICSSCSLNGLELRYSKTYDFERISTFRFESKACGIVGISIDEKDGLIEFIRENIEQNLKIQGFIPVRTHPETKIRFGLILKGNGKNLDPRHIKPLTSDGVEIFASTFDYKPGSLIIDAVDPFYNEIIWRTAVDTKILPETPLEIKKKRIEEILKLQLKDFLNRENVSEHKL